MSLFWHCDHLLNRSAGSMPKSVQHSSQEPETATLFPFFVFHLPLTILYIRLTHSLLLIFRLRVSSGEVPQWLASFGSSCVP